MALFYARSSESESDLQGCPIVALLAKRLPAALASASFLRIPVQGEIGTAEFLQGSESNQSHVIPAALFAAISFQIIAQIVQLLHFPDFQADCRCIVTQSAALSKPVKGRHIDVKIFSAR